MNRPLTPREHMNRFAQLGGARDAILALQRPDGAIPWIDRGPWDPWNHSECVMALGVMERFEAAEKGFAYLEASQKPDGSWLGEYGNALPMEDDVRMARQPAPAFHDSNFSAYPAVAVWHALRLTGDVAMAKRRWPMIDRAITFVLGLQNPAGDITWSTEGRGTDKDDSLMAGNGAIYLSLGAALKLADVLGEPREHWRVARAKLRDAIMHHPERFDRAGQDHARFAMDWYYPILGGALPPAMAKARLEQQWSRFVEPGLGCRCVRDEPWVTIAETAELCMALKRMGRAREAADILGWQDQFRDRDGAYWMGWQFREKIFWPQEKPSWTQAAVILAHDAIYGETAAHDVIVGD